MFYRALGLTLLLLSACSAAPTPPGQPSGEIPWDQAVALLPGGNVDAIYQAHDLWVRLTMKDGTFYDTREPSLDRIFHELAACGAACADIGQITE